MKYYAKSDPVQTLREHTDEALRLWKGFCNIYGKHFSEEEQELIDWAVFYHDIGKINPHFQQKICRAIHEKYNGKEAAGEEIPHGYLSGAYMDIAYLEHKFGGIADLLLTAVYYHHTRARYFSREALEEYAASYLPELYEYSDGHTLKVNTDYVYYVMEALGDSPTKTSSISEEDWLKYIVIKGMLNKIDYAASAGEVETAEIEPYPPGTLTQNVREKLPELRAVQHYMAEHKEENLVVTAATGNGKTEAALCWLDGWKCFYTLPLKVSINAIYERIRDAYAYDSKKITLLHSDLVSYYFARQEKQNDAVQEPPIVRQKRARLLSYPLTICTVDQLFWFVFKSMGSELIPATLKYSKVIIDEIQMYSPQILACLIYGMKVITRLGGKFAILTATFPPVLKHFIQQQQIPCTFCPEKFLGEYQHRHKIALLEGDFDYAQIAEAGCKRKVLVLCNTVGKAQAVYRELKASENVHLLHSRFARKDRSCLEKQIMAFSQQNSGAGIWISTQIVEASLDIDFDVLFTEMCPADSLLQRMGRCYRKRDYDLKETEPNVYIYNTKNGYGKVYEFKGLYDISWELLKAYDGQSLYETDKFRYIDEVYDVERLKKEAAREDEDKSYYGEIKRNLDNLNKLQPGDIQMKQAHQKFRDIQSVAVMPNQFYELAEVQRCIEILAGGRKESREDRLKAEQALMQYTVSVDRSILNDKKAHYPALKLIEALRWLEIYRATCLYDFDGNSGMGLCLEIEG